MTEGKFEKITPSEKLLHGPPALLLCGFSEAAQSKFKSLLSFVDLSAIKLVWATRDQAAMSMSELLKLPNATGFGVSSDLPRAIIVSGIQEKKFYHLMTICRQSGMQPALWAVLTPTSETWTLKTLLLHLDAERQRMRRTSN